MCDLFVRKLCGIPFAVQADQDLSAWQPKRYRINTVTSKRLPLSVGCRFDGLGWTFRSNPAPSVSTTGSIARLFIFRRPAPSICTQSDRTPLNCLPISSPFCGYNCAFLCAKISLLILGMHFRCSDREEPVATLAVAILLLMQRNFSYRSVNSYALAKVSLCFELFSQLSPLVHLSLIF